MENSSNNTDPPTSLQRCQAAAPVTRRPALRCPPGSTDTHIHIYGPDDVYPPAPTRRFDVPDALPADVHRMYDMLGIDRVVLVQPSGYGFDNRRQLDALSELRLPARAVVSLPLDTPSAELARMHALGVRGVRFSTHGANLRDMEAMARMIAPLGWHVQLHVLHGADTPSLTQLAPLFKRLASDVVFDHLGSIDPAKGLGQPDFELMLELLAARKCWVKLSAGYRMSSEPAPYRDLVPYAKALADAAADRLVWGSDWPHVNVKGAMPDTVALLDLVEDWAPGAALQQKILVDNPAVLYGF